MKPHTTAHICKKCNAPHIGYCPDTPMVTKRIITFQEAWDYIRTTLPPRKMSESTEKTP